MTFPDPAEWFRHQPCPNCGRAPYTRHRHQFLTTTFPCRCLRLHWSRTCLVEDGGCGWREVWPAQTERCAEVDHARRGT